MLDYLHISLSLAKAVDSGSININIPGNLGMLSRKLPAVTLEGLTFC